MLLPFSRQEFLQVFNDYNQAIWPLQVVTVALGVAAVGYLFSNSNHADRIIATILGLFWIIGGGAYHWLYFTRINPAAYLFAGLFVMAAAIFLIEGTVRDRIRFRVKRGSDGWWSLTLMAYALIVYPVVGLSATHPYPETPLFGVAPCPTTIFTLALLMVAVHPRPLLLATIPMLWAAIGGSAAVLLDMPQDWGLIVAGVAWLIVWMRGRKTPVPRGHS